MPNLKGKKPPRNMTFDTMEKAKAFFFAWIFPFALLGSVMETESQCDISALSFDFCSIKLLLLERGRRSLLFGKQWGLLCNKLEGEIIFPK